MITPRDIADKSRPEKFRQGITLALAEESASVRRNTQSFNKNRYASLKEIDDYQELKDKARSIKEQSIEHLPELIKQLQHSIESNGGVFYLAKSARDANDYVLRVCQKHNARLVVKGKSMTTEEIRLNSHLEAAEIEVAETDLAEFILQYADEQPSHIVAPAIHKSREGISRLFKEKFNPAEPLETGEELTRFARAKLREKFLKADIGITGANIIAADTGTIVLVESEGNIRLSYSLPPVHIAVAGIEKVIPHFSDLGTFIELLAPSGTGQPLTSYTSVINPPFKISDSSFLKEKSVTREFHLVLVDNGRMAMRDDPVLKEALYCIRCSACLNSCANFQSLGGHAFGGETYSGGIGGSWEAGTRNLSKARFSDLCTGCSRCVPQCPVKIDIPWLNENLRARIAQKEGKTLQKLLLVNYGMIAAWGSRFSFILNKVNSIKITRKLIEYVIGISSERELPEFVSKTLMTQAKNFKSLQEKQHLVLFTDVYTNHHYPQRGMAALAVFRALGYNISVSSVQAAGRDALSQGEIGIARRKAEQTARHLMRYIDNGVKIIVVEPSILALFKRDYQHLLTDQHQIDLIRQNCFDPFEFLLSEQPDFARYFDAAKLKNAKIFYHSHCQEKTIGTTTSVIEVLKKLGLSVEISDVECCGMAGSFGYKKQFYEVSKRVGEDLVQQIEAKEKDGERILLATGISCKDQISHMMKRESMHPMQLLERMLKHAGQSPPAH